ncbi:MAG: Flp pilus assembly protein CpaB [Nevskiales bacterium]|nr:Flp pilus assembly protein CpaB [Nevskiales bacterium]
MSSTALKVIAVVSVLVAVILAVVGYRVSQDFAERAEQAQVQVQQQQVEQVLAVVALKSLAAYKAIPRDAVALVPVSVEPADPYTNLEDVVGKVPLVDIDAGAPVTQRYFKEGNVLARIIPPKHQAVSVEVSDVIAVGGFVRPGDIVDVLLYIRGGGDQKSQSRVLLKDARVLAYEERIIDRPEGLKDEDEKRRARVRTAVIAVPEDDTTRLMLGASVGELRLALHSQSIELAQGEDGEGLPVADAAVAASADKKVPDKAISLDELARIKPPPSRKVVVRPRVQIVRGTASETVTIK